MYGVPFMGLYSQARRVDCKLTPWLLVKKNNKSPLKPRTVWCFGYSDGQKACLLGNTDYMIFICYKVGALGKERRL